jgi:prepilin-type N-terminal cleavage/methylation domain-containing protein
MRNRHAFSVVELLVALMILSVAVLGTTAAVGLAARAQREAIARREAIGALESRLASLSMSPCASLTNDSVLLGGVTVTALVERTDSLASILLSATHRGTSSALRAEVACE